MLALLLAPLLLAPLLRRLLLPSTSPFSSSGGGERLFVLRRVVRRAAI